MADTPYSGLAIANPTQADIFAVAKTGPATSVAVTVSSAVSAAVSTGVLFSDQFSAGDPASTAVGTLRAMGRNVAGQMRLVTVGEYGDWRPVQRSLFNDSAYLWWGNSSAPGATLGGIMTNAGSFSSAAPVVGSAWSTKRRAVYSTSNAGVSTANAGMTTGNNDYFMGSTSGYGGYFFFARVGLESYSTNTRAFVGFTPTASNQICSTNPSAMINSVGFAFDITESSWTFKHSSSGTASSETIVGQTILTDANSTAKLGYDFYIFAPPTPPAIIYYRMDELVTGSTIVNGSVTTHLPNATSFAKGAAMMGTSSNSVKIGIVKMYIETTT